MTIESILKQFDEKLKGQLLFLHTMSTELKDVEGVSDDIKAFITKALEEQKKELRKEIGQIDRGPCVCKTSRETGQCEYNRGFDKALWFIVNLLDS